MDNISGLSVRVVFDKNVPGLCSVLAALMSTWDYFEKPDSFRDLNRSREREGGRPCSTLSAKPCSLSVLLFLLLPRGRLALPRRSPVPGSVALASAARDGQADRSSTTKARIGGRLEAPCCSAFPRRGAAGWVGSVGYELKKDSGLGPGLRCNATSGKRERGRKKAREKLFYFGAKLSTLNTLFITLSA